MLFYVVAFMFFQAAFYICVGAFIIFLLGMLIGLVKPVDQMIVYQACLWLIALTLLCRFIANEIMRKIKRKRLKGD